MTFQTLSAENAAPPVGPYSPALKVGHFLYISGQIPLDSHGAMVTGDFEAETRQVCQNISSLLNKAGCGWEHLVKVTIFTTDLSKFDLINAVYSEFVSAPYPARAAVEVVGLPKGARIEMEAIAYVE